MKPLTRNLICILVVTAVVVACSSGATPVPTSPPTPAPTRAATTAALSCPQVVQRALDTVAERCKDIGANQACYGNASVEATTANNAAFNAPGDMVRLADLQTLRTTPLNEQAGTWGIAVMRAAVNLPGTTAGQQVTFLMYGDTTLDSVSADMTTVSFRTGVGQPACSEVPPSGLTVQVPRGQRITFTANGAVISLGSTAILLAEPDKVLSVSVLQGEAEVTSKGVSQLVGEGTRVEVPLRGLTADAPPSAPQPIPLVEVSAAPVQLLSEPISPVQVATSINAASTQLVRTMTPRPTSATSTPGTPVPSITPLLTWTPIPTISAIGAGSNRIAFATNRDGNWEIYVMNADGSSPIRLTNQSGDDQSPAWSPDGRLIAFASYTGQTRQIFVVSDSGGDLRPFTQSNVSADHPAWSSNGQQIAYDALQNNNRDIWVANADGNNAHALASDPADDSEPAWSPDGNRIAFVSTRNGSKEIFVMDANGNNVSRLTSNPAEDRSPAWSPDGTRIAFVSNRGGNADIYVMNADGSDVRRLVSGPGSDDLPAWSADGSQIAFVSDREGTRAIYTINVTGDSNVRRLTDLAADSDNPAWQR